MTLLGIALLGIALLSCLCLTTNGAIFSHHAHNAKTHPHKLHALESYTVLTSRIDVAEVVFFRHGQSEWNTLYDHTGDKIRNYFRSRNPMFWDSPLSPNGVHDALYIARLLLHFAAEDPNNLDDSTAAEAVTQMFENEGIKAVPAHVAYTSISEIEPDAKDNMIFPESAFWDFASKVMNPKHKLKVFTSNLHRALDTGFLAMIPRFAIDPSFKIFINSDLQETDANGDCEATSSDLVGKGGGVVRELIKDPERKDPYGDQRELFAQAHASELYRVLVKLYAKQHSVYNLGNNPIVGSVNTNDATRYSSREQLSNVRLGFAGYTSGKDVVGNFGNRIHYTAPPTGGRQVNIAGPFHVLAYDDTLNVIFSHSRYFKDLLYNFATVASADLPLLQQIAHLATDTDDPHAQIARIIATTPYTTNCASPQFAKKLKPGSGVKFDLVKFRYQTMEERGVDRYVMLMANCRFVIPSKAIGMEEE